MDKVEARAILDSELAKYRIRTYAELLARRDQISAFEVLGKSGARYQIEIEVMWDSPSEKKNLRVIGGIDDGRFLSALRPLGSDFIMAPDGSFVGE